MIKVEHAGHDVYVVTFGAAELSIISKIAIGYGVTKAVAVGSCINKGIIHSQSALQEIAEHEKRKRDNQESGG